MSPALSVYAAAFRNRARTRLVRLTDVLAREGAGHGALLRVAELLSDALDLLDAPLPCALPEPRLRLLLERLAELAALHELELEADPDAPLPLPAPPSYPGPIYEDDTPVLLFPVGTAGQVWTSRGPAGAHWADLPAQPGGPGGSGTTVTFEQVVYPVTAAGAQAVPVPAALVILSVKSVMPSPYGFAPLELDINTDLLTRDGSALLIDAAANLAPGDKVRVRALRLSGGSSAPTAGQLGFTPLPILLA